MVGTQFEFNFDPVRSAQARDEAMVRVERNAHEEWKDVALEAVYQAALVNGKFIVDEVWRYMPPDVSTHELRAMGAVMKKAAKAGWIIGTGEYEPSAKVSTHKGLRHVWRSLISTFQAPA